MASLHVLRVFCRESGGGGNPLGVFLDGTEVEESRRQAIATDLGFSETVFVDDAARGEMRIFTPAEELPFAGHPSVGTAWLLSREREAVEVLRPPAGEVAVQVESQLTFARAQAEWCPAIDFVQLESPAEVEAAPLAAEGFVYIWAWADEVAGEVRSRSFVPVEGIPEDEATGAAAIALCAALGRPIQISQGAGSRLIARPTGEGEAEVGGRVELDRVREYE